MRETLALGAAAAAGFSVGFVIEAGGGVTEVVAMLLGASIVAGSLYAFTVTGPRISFIGYLATSAKFGSIAGGALPLGVYVPRLIELDDRTWDLERQDVAMGVVGFGFIGAVVGVSIGVALLSLRTPGTFRSRTPGGSDAETDRA